MPSSQKGIRYKIAKIFGVHKKFQSETSKVRHLVLPYCNGMGCDVGFGGDKIRKDNCLGIDLKRPYSKTAGDKVDIACDMGKESIPVAENYFDYVYSSHLIEDFEDTNRILADFVRVCKSGGNIILVFPDQAVYEKHCSATGQLVNVHHVHKNMGFDYMMECLKKTEQQLNFTSEILFKSDREIDYNVVIVIKITKQ